MLKGVTVTRDDNIGATLSKISFPAIVKSQIAIGSRKKVGLIKIAQTRDEGVDLCRNYFQRELSGYKVEAVLVEELAEIKHEYYCSITLDASGRQFYLLASKEGGIEIEEVAVNTPELIIRKNFNITNGLTEQIAQEVSSKLGFNNHTLKNATDIFLKMWKIALETEALLVEINPLALTPTGLIALDGKMVLDENAVFRRPITKEFQEKKLTDFEKYANENNLFFVELDGEVGVLGNGAGLTIELVDVLSEMGIKPANFLDLGGGAKPERVYKALELIIKLNPKAILINIFGGITRCDYIAEGIVQALKRFKDAPPMVIRLMGTKHLEGIEILKKEGINAFKDFLQAVEKIKTLITNG